MPWELFFLLAIVGIGVALYNGLVKLRVQVDTAWADVEVQLKRRHDLIPNLVETVKGYAGHERQTLEAVAAARSAAMGARTPGEKAQAEQALSGALKSLFALSEAYPQLQAAGGFQDLQRTLQDVENHIRDARRYYNAVVRDYNTRIAQVPTNLLAQAFHFKSREFFEIAEGEEEVPRVSFS